MLANPSPPSPPPPAQTISESPESSGEIDGHSSGATVLIIVGIIAFVIAASASIHLILRLISRSRSSSSSSSSSSTSSPPSPTPLLRSVSSNANRSESPSDREKLISSLPLFSLASSVASFRNSSSLDCAVCLSKFRSQDELRLLPACRHAFHSQCVDTWIRSTPSCPLCRASIHLPPTPPQGESATIPAVDSSRSGSFRIELGSVSRRTATGDSIPAARGRSYSLGSSYEYFVDEEVEAVLESLRWAPERKTDSVGSRAPPALTPEIGDAGVGGGRGWLRDCVDRLTHSSSSSFNSLRFSGRIGSHRLDQSPTATGSGFVGRSWDLEGNTFPNWEEESGFASFYRWLVGV